MKARTIKMALLALVIAFNACKSTDFSEESLINSEKQLVGLREVAVKENKIPRTVRDGELAWVRKGYDWTIGFWPGTCWMMYEKTKDPKWKEAAISGQKLYIDFKDLTNDHDLGFIFNNSFGKCQL